MNINMIRTQIYLTERQRKDLYAIAKQVGKSQSELIRQAIDQYIETFQHQNRRSLLQQAKGMWKEREDLPDFQALRRELDRFYQDET